MRTKEHLILHEESSTFKHPEIKMQILNFCTCTFPIEVVGRINSINLVRSCL